jgi:hypothetical protein
MKQLQHQRATKLQVNDRSPAIAHDCQLLRYTFLFLKHIPGRLRFRHIYSRLIATLSSFIAHVLSRKRLDLLPAQLGGANTLPILCNLSEGARDPSATSPVRIVLHDWKLSKKGNKTLLIFDFGNENARQEAVGGSDIL